MDPCVFCAIAAAEVDAELTVAVGPLYGAAGSIVFQSNVAPDDPLFHLHVHVVPRFSGDQFV